MEKTVEESRCAKKAGETETAIERGVEEPGGKRTYGHMLLAAVSMAQLLTHL